MRWFGFACQRYLDWIWILARTRALTLEIEPIVFDVGRFIHVEINVNRVERNDRRQQRRAALAALHEIACTDEMAADPAADRRRHVGKFDVELGGLQRTLGLQLSGLGGLQRLPTLIDNGIRNRLGLIQCKRTVELTSGEFRLGAGVRELAIGLLRDGLKRASIDHV